MVLTDAQNLFALFFAIYFAMIIQRSHEMYKPWDTYHAWKGKSHSARRLLAAWGFLFIIPLVHFAILFVILGSVHIPFDMTVDGISNVLFIGVSSFFEFGYFRIYESFLHGYPEYFFSDEDLGQMGDSGGFRPDFRAHFIPGICYVIVSSLMIGIAIYF